MGDYLSYGLNTLGPLCLWQCFKLAVQACSVFQRLRNSWLGFLLISSGYVLSVYLSYKRNNKIFSNRDL